MDGFQVFNSDILADLLPGNVYVLDDYRQHIGNSRFAVLVEMYHEAFHMSYCNNSEDECDKIVQRIVDVTCHKDVNIRANRGRFVVKTLAGDGVGGAGGGWRCLDDEESMELVRQALVATAMKQAVGEEEELEPIPITSPFDISCMDIPSVDFGNLGLNDDSNKKRGRRQSLLRRSVSESTMMFDKKKLYRNVMSDVSIKDISPPPPGRRYHSHGIANSLPPQQPQAAGSSVTVESNISGSAIPTKLARNSAYSSGGNTVPTFRGMDVVLASDRRSLSANPDSLGNNRLNVVLSLEKGRFTELSHDEQLKIATDLVKKVTEFWGGQILVENLFVYDVLSHQEAVEAFHNLLLPEEEDPFASFSDTNDAVSSANVCSSSSSATKKPLLSAAPPMPEFLRNAARMILNGDREDAKAGPEQMQSEARRSLQERKAKRQISKGLGSARNLGN